jgi:hypothetical protein
MAVIEYGPKDVDFGKGRFLEVTRFVGRHLTEIEEQVKLVVHDNVLTTRAELEALLDLSGKKAERFNLGLDILNQLSVLSKKGADVNSVVVYQVPGTEVYKFDGRQGRGKPHYRYSIDWINAPEEVTPEPPKAEPQVIYPFKTAAQREAELPPSVIAEREQANKRKKKRQERERLDREKRAEVEAVKTVMLDGIRQGVDYSINQNLIKIENDDQGQASVYFRKHTHQDFSLVDRESGEFIEPGFGEKSSFNAETLTYLRFLADQSEGKEVIYPGPAKQPDEVYQDIYERAIMVGVLSPYKHPESGLVFYFEDPNRVFVLIRQARVIDLENNIVKAGYWDTVEYCLNPHFTEFLKAKKAQLEAGTKAT